MGLPYILGYWWQTNMEVMGTIFKANESNREQEIGKLKENLAGANKKIASLEEKYVLNEIERESYSFMKPRFKDEISKLREKLSDLESKETNYMRYLNSGITLLQNLTYYYEAASLPNKQKLLGSIFLENLIIENGKCITARENEVIRALKGFEKDFKKERPRISRSFRSGRLEDTDIELFCSKFKRLQGFQGSIKQLG